MSRKKIVILNDSSFNSGSLFTNLDLKLELSKEQKKDYSLIDAPKKRGRKKRNRMYFTQETEDAIVRYNKETDVATKHEIYEKYIKYSFEKLAENMINTFSFSYIADQYRDIKAEVVSKMILEMHQYDQSIGKAFSYFSIIAKNYLIILNNESYKELKSTKSIEDFFNNKDNNDGVEYDIVDEEYEKNIINRENNEFISLLVQYWENNIPNVFKKSRDIEIAYAVVELLNNVDSLEFFNKKALYLLIREITGHKTQYITKVINKMMLYYNKLKNDYLTYGFIKEDNLIFYNRKKR